MLLARPTPLDLSHDSRGAISRQVVPPPAGIEDERRIAKIILETGCPSDEAETTFAGHRKSRETGNWTEVPLCRQSSSPSEEGQPPGLS